MNKFAKWCLISAMQTFARLILPLRYSIRRKGVESLKTSEKGTLFLANHTCLLDPFIVLHPLVGKFHPHPIADEDQYETPGINAMMRAMGTIPVPNMEIGRNSLKLARINKMFSSLSEILNAGESAMIFPSGRLKAQGLELIGGASSVHTLLQTNPDVQIVLCRVNGLWGSSWSRALEGQTPNYGGVFRRALWILLKNFIFFAPRRRVTTEYVVAGPDFPRKGTRLEINQWLEVFFNADRTVLNPSPEQKALEGIEVGEPVSLVRSSIWSNKRPELFKHNVPDIVDISDVPPAVIQKVRKQLSQLKGMPEASILPEQTLSRDLGLDSLDLAELTAWLDTQFGQSGFRPIELRTVACLIAAAAGKLRPEHEEAPSKAQEEDREHWDRPVHPERLHIAPGTTLQECFLNACAVNPNAIACRDDISGLLTYKRLKLGAIILANEIRKLPGENIGILLPAVSGAFVTLFACMLAGKKPVMMNWTVGARHLAAVAEASKVEVILTSKAFINKLDNVDFGGVEDKIVTLDAIRKKIGLSKKIKGLITSRMPTRVLTKRYGKAKADDIALYLFTSGTENLPKGVPLTHKNILSNIESAISTIPITSQDVLLAFLPPFHCFGCIVTGILPIITRIRVSFSPNPTDNLTLARSLSKWKATALVGAPTFVRGILQASTEHDLSSLRFVVTGAEKTPADLIAKIHALPSQPRWVEGYGCTECSPIITANLTGLPENGIGRPINGMEVAIIHPDTQALMPQGQHGLIVAAGDSVFGGYLGGEGSPFVEVDGKRHYNTGDLGYIDGNGNVHITGRLKRFAKVGGEMVSLGAIEEALTKAAPERGWSLDPELPSIAVCAVESSQKTVFVLFTSFETSLEAVNQAISAAGLGNIARITYHKQLEKLPVTGTGKTHYRELNEQAKTLTQLKQ